MHQGTGVTQNRPIQNNILKQSNIENPTPLLGYNRNDNENDDDDSSEGSSNDSDDDDFAADFEDELMDT